MHGLCMAWPFNRQMTALLQWASAEHVGALRPSGKSVLCVHNNRRQAAPSAVHNMHCAASATYTTMLEDAVSACIV